MSSGGGGGHGSAGGPTGEGPVADPGSDVSWGGKGVQVPSTFRDPAQKFGSSGPAPSGDSYFWVAGGGGGASYPGYRPEPNNGGSGGGGRGALYGSPTTDVGDGVQNSGGGGGGGVHSSPNANQTHGGAGGSGLVIIAYPT